MQMRIATRMRGEGMIIGGGQPGKAEKMLRYSSLQMNLEREEVKEVK